MGDQLGVNLLWRPAGHWTSALYNLGILKRSIMVVSERGFRGGTRVGTNPADAVVERSWLIGTRLVPNKWAGTNAQVSSDKRGTQRKEFPDPSNPSIVRGKGSDDDGRFLLRAPQSCNGELKHPGPKELLPFAGCRASVLAKRGSARRA